MALLDFIKSMSIQDIINKIMICLKVISTYIFEFSWLLLIGGYFTTLINPNYDADTASIFIGLKKGTLFKDYLDSTPFGFPLMMQTFLLKQANLGDPFFFRLFAICGIVGSSILVFWIARKYLDLSINVSFIMASFFLFSRFARHIGTWHVFPYSLSIFLSTVVLLLSIIILVDKGKTIQTNIIILFLSVCLISFFVNPRKILFILVVMTSTLFLRKELFKYPINTITTFLGIIIMFIFPAIFLFILYPFKFTAVFRTTLRLLAILVYTQYQGSYLLYIKIL